MNVATHRAASRILTAADRLRFSDFVRVRTGLEFPGQRQAELERAIAAALDETGARDVEELLGLLEDVELGRGRLERVASALTIGETHFFRDRGQFDVLERHILPELIRRRRDSRRLRVWSAGCSTGEEPYSVAILLARLLPDLDEWDVAVLGTDIDRRALEKALGGRYGSWSFRGVPEQTVGAFFTRHGGELELVPAVRSLVRFDYLNLVEDVYPSLLNGTAGVDLVLCRNVLLYFGAATAERVLTRLAAALSPGGWLLIGHSDPRPAACDELVPRKSPAGLAYERRPSAVTFLGEPRAQAPPISIPSRESPATSSALPGFAPAPERVAEPPPVERDEEPADAYLAAKQAADSLDLEAAERWIELALARAPLDAPCHFLHGLILQETGRPAEAVAAMRRCAAADPELVLGHYALGTLLVRLGQPRRGGRSLDNAARLLRGRASDEEIAGGDGLSAGQLRELVRLQSELLAAELAAAP